MKILKIDGLTAFWQTRQPRERRALAFLAAALAVILVGNLLWSAHVGRQRLRAQLPRLAAEVEEMRAGAEEWRRLAAVSERRGGLPAAEMRKQVEAGAAALGLTATWRDAVVGLSGRADFDAWVKWLAQVQTDYGLRVLRARATAAAPGQVKVEAELGFDRPDAP